MEISKMTQDELNVAKNKYNLESIQVTKHGKRFKVIIKYLGKNHTINAVRECFIYKSIKCKVGEIDELQRRYWE